MIRCLVVLATVFWLQATPILASELTEERFQKLHTELQPDDSALWRSIPWQTSLLGAQRMAAERKQPLFIWAMDGHPLGCT